MEEIFGWMKTVDRWFPAYAGIGGWIGPAWGYPVATACNLVGMAKLMLNHQGGKTPVVGTE